MKNYIFSFHEKLNQNLFEEDELKESVRKKLIDIAEFAIESAEINKKYIDDIILTGSNASFHYNEYSDIDLHVVYDISKIKDEEKRKIFKKYLDEKRRILNLKFDFKIKNHKVEIYFQDKTEPHYSQGIYSVLNNRWLKYPKKNETEINKKDIVKKLKRIIKDIKILIEKYPNDYDQWNNMVKNILNMRKKALKKDSKSLFSNENIIFKFLRKTRILNTLINYLNKLKSKELTLERKNA